MEPTSTASERYTEYIAVSGEGLRFGLLSCKRCGVALIIGLGDDPMARHDKWHEKRENPTTPAKRNPKITEPD